MDKVTVSVIIPVYNAARYLQETLESVMTQSLRDLEIICVDDGSEDESVEIIETYMQQDARISLYHQTEKSDNAALARNLGIEKSKGEYLIFLDADDVFEKDMIFKAYQKAQDTDAEIVMFNIYIQDTCAKMDLYIGGFYDQSILYGREIIVPEKEINNLFHIMGESVCNKLYKRNVIVNNEIQFRPIRQCDDWEFGALAVCYAHKVALLNERLLRYRRDAENSQTSDYSINWSAGFWASYYLKEQLLSRGLYGKYKVPYAKKAVGKILYYLRNLYTMDAYREFFCFIKENIHKLDIINALREDVNAEEFLEKLDLIMQSETAEEYLFKITRSTDLYHAGCFRLPISVGNKRRKVVLYGAGQEGRKIYNALKCESDIEIVGWLDRRHKEYGWGIKAPESIVDMEYDYVFIAIRSRRISAQVKEYLINLGCEEGRVIEMIKN